MRNSLKFLFLLLVVTFLGCNKDEEIVKADEVNFSHSNVSRAVNDVVCESGVLIFKNWDAYYQIDSTLSTYSFQERKAWEDALNFKSQKQIFDNIAIKEYDIFITPYENMPESYFQENPEPDHCAEYYVAINDGIIEDIFDDGHYMDYKVKDISKVAFINAKGFVKIDSILYQYKGDLIKYMINGSVQDCDLLNSTNVSNEDLNIIVAKVPDGGTGGDFGDDDGGDGNNSDKPFYKNASNKCNWEYSGKCRARSSTFVEIKGYGFFNTFEYTSQLDCRPLKIILESQRKNGWGNWHMYHGDYNISGSTRIAVDEGYPSGATNPFYYGTAMLNFQTVHGNTGSFPVTEKIKMNYFNGIIWASVISKVFWCNANVNPIHFNIRADIAGGASGIVVYNNFQ